MLRSEVCALELFCLPVSMKDQEVQALEAPDLSKTGSISIEFVFFWSSMPFFLLNSEVSFKLKSCVSSCWLAGAKNQ